MAVLSISRAWEETKARIATDGRLFSVVAAALVVLPALVLGVVSPRTPSTEPTLLSVCIVLLSSLLALIGQIAIIRLAIRPAVSVGEAIAHGAKRLPVYFVAGVIVAIGLIVAAIPFFVALASTGVPIGSGDEAAMREALAQSPLALLFLFLFIALACFVGIRMLMSSPVASEEATGPITILKRSWQLTGGHWWRLFAFLILFLIGAGIAMAAISWAVSLVATMLFGPVEPMSISALIVALVDAIANAVVTVILAVMLARIYVQLAGGESVSVPSSGT